jgi:DNA-binding CsgD family transcriptional regulator
VLQGAGRLSAANALFEKLMPALAQDRYERLCLTDPAADGLLGQAVLRATVRPEQGAVNSIPVAATEATPPMILHLLPVCGSAHDFFSQAKFLLVITPVDRAVVPTAKVLQGLFDLTPAEARIARGIGEAQTIEHLAITAGVSVETVRSQLKAVLSKTGLTRQQELVSLLAGKVLPAAPSKPAS